MGGELLMTTTWVVVLRWLGKVTVESHSLEITSEGVLVFRDVRGEIFRAFNAKEWGEVKKSDG